MMDKGGEDVTHVRNVEMALAPPDRAPVLPPRAPATVKSAYRTMQILELLASRPNRLSLTELQRELEIPKSSLHNLLQTMVERGWLETDARGTVYGIGIRALRVGVIYLERDPVVQAAGPLLAELRRLLDETMHLARLDGSDVVYLASRESAHHLRSSSRIGRRLPAHTTALGKALLAARPPAEVDHLLPETLVALTPDTVTDRAVLRAELAETRQHGWSFEQGQNTSGLACIAVAVPGQHPAIDAISCSVPLVRLTPEHKEHIIDTLVHAASELGHIGRGIGW